MAVQNRDLVVVAGLVERCKRGERLNLIIRPSNIDLCAVARTKPIERKVIFYRTDDENREFAFFVHEVKPSKISGAVQHDLSARYSASEFIRYGFDAEVSLRQHAGKSRQKNSDEHEFGHTSIVEHARSANAGGRWRPRDATLMQPPESRVVCSTPVSLAG